MDKIFEELRQIAESEFSKDGQVLSLNSYVSELDVDSLDVIEFAFEVENKIGLVFDPSKIIEEQQTVEELLKKIIEVSKSDS